MTMGMHSGRADRKGHRSQGLGRWMMAGCGPDSRKMGARAKALSTKRGQSSGVIGEDLGLPRGLN